MYSANVKPGKKMQFTIKKSSVQKIQIRIQRVGRSYKKKLKNQKNQSTISSVKKNYFTFFFAPFEAPQKIFQPRSQMADTKKMVEKNPPIQPSSLTPSRMVKNCRRICRDSICMRSTLKIYSQMYISISIRGKKSDFRSERR